MIVTKLKSLIGILALIGALVAFADSPSMQVSSFDDSTGSVVLSFSGITADMSVYVLWDAEDQGLDSRNWANASKVAQVSAGTSELTVTLPAGIDVWNHAVRFSLVAETRFDPLSYIASDGRQYVDTGYRPWSTDSVEMDFSLLDVSAGFGIFDARNASNSKCYTAMMEAPYGGGGAQHGTMRINLVDSKNYSSQRFQTVEGPSKAVQYSLKADFAHSNTQQAKVYINDEQWVTVSKTPTKTQSDLTLMLFGYRASGTPTYATTKMRLFGFKITDSDGAVKRDLIPVEKDGVPQLYDKENDVFYASKGTAPFVAGPVSLQSAVAVSDLLDNVPAMDERTVSVVSYDPATWTAELSFSIGSSAKFLYVLKADRDMGADPNSWEKSRFLAEIPAATTSLSCQIPEELRGQGAVRFFLSRWADSNVRQRILPLSYIESDGRQYVDTGYRPWSTDSVEMGFSLLDVSAGFGIFDARNASNGKCYTAMMERAYDGEGWERGTLRINLVDSKNYSSQRLQAVERSSKDAQYSLKADFAHSDTQNAKVYINDEQWVTVSATPTKTQSDPTLMLFGYRSGGTPTYATTKMRLFGFKITDSDGAVKRDLIPVEKDGVPQLYDRENDVFYPSEGTAAFLAGTGVDGYMNVMKFAETSSTGVLVGCPSVSARVQSSQGQIVVRLGPSDGAGRIYVACDTTDQGGRISAWSRVALLGAVEASPVQRDIAYPLPQGWEGAGPNVCRVFYLTAESYYPDSLLSYIESDGRQYVDTGYRPWSTDSVEMDFSLLDVSAGFGIFDARNESYGKCYTAMMERAYDGEGWERGTLRINLVDSKNYSSQRLQAVERSSKDAQYSLKADFAHSDTQQAKVYINDEQWVTVLATPTKTQSDPTLMLFGYRSGGTPTYATTKMRLFGFKITDSDGAVKRDLIPVEKDGVPQLYDRENDVFYPSEGTAAFVAGEKLNDYAADSEILSFSPSFLRQKGIIIVVR